MIDPIIKLSVEKLEDYIIHSNYKGYDPYDILKSPLFKLPFFNKNKWLRFGFQQLGKRLPFNIRPILFVPKGYNPVTLGLCIQAYSYLIETFPQKKEFYFKQIEYLIDELNKLIPKGYSGACWGYDFDWEARYSKIPAYQPTVVATGIITNALYVTWQITKIDKCKDLILSASKFVLNDLNRIPEDDTFCFSYSPFDKGKVFNASLKGIRLLAQAYSLNHDEKLRETAKEAIPFIIKYQQENGSWNYSLSKTGGWIDNYHSGYVVDCLDEYINHTNDFVYKNNLLKGYEFYYANFFTKNNAPKFYSEKVLPIDCTAASQSLLTLSRFGDIEKAKQVAFWTIKNMQSKSGNFYFRKFKFYTVRTSFMRWSNAWMFVGLSYLLMNLKSDNKIN